MRMLSTYLRLPPRIVKPSIPRATVNVEVLRRVVVAPPSRLARSFFSTSSAAMTVVEESSVMTAPAASHGIDPGPGKAKLHGRAFYESIGSPKYVVAPMVSQSEFAWRMLTRSFLSPAEQPKVLAYTPMFHARLFRDSENHREQYFQPTNSWDPKKTDGKPFLDGNPAIDRPLFVQFCANDPDALLGAAQRVAPYCDAVDINFGCPQGIARKGHYGAFLQEDQDLVYRLINTLHKNLDVPVTAKIRVLETREATLAYAKNVLNAGASILTVHGRQRDQKGHLTGLADWSTIRWLRDQLPPETVMFANGNILQRDDMIQCLEATGADAVMSAEGNLSDPALFAEPPPPGSQSREYWRGRDGKGGWRVDAILRRYLDILYKYVGGVEPPTRRPLFVPGDKDTAWMGEETEDDEPARKKQKRSNGGGKKKMKQPGPNYAGVQPHLFHMLRHFVSIHTDVRDVLAKSYPGDMDCYEKILAAVERKVAEGLLEYKRTDGHMFDGYVIPALAKRIPAAKQTEGEEAAAAAAEAATATNGANEATTEKKAEESKEATGNGQAELKDEDDDPESSAAAVKRCWRPWWVAQPIVRPLPKEALAKGAISLSKKNKQKMEEMKTPTERAELSEAQGTNGKSKAAAAEKNGNASTEEKVLKETDQLLSG